MAAITVKKKKGGEKAYGVCLRKGKARYWITFDSREAAMVWISENEETWKKDPEAFPKNTKQSEEWKLRMIILNAKRNIPEIVKKGDRK